MSPHSELERLRDEVATLRELLEIHEQTASEQFALLGDREARLRAVVESTLDALITINEAGTIESVNPAAERIFGWSRGDLLGKNVRMLMPEPFRGQHDGYLANYLRTGVRKIIGIGREVVGQRRDGTTFPMDLAVTEVGAGAGRLFLGLVRDISERRRAEVTKTSLLARDAFQQGRIETASGILHDLGNALTGVGARAVDAQTVVESMGAIGGNLARTATFLRANAEAIAGALGPERAGALPKMLEGITAEQARLSGGALASLRKLLGFLSHAQELLSTHRSFHDAQVLMADAMIKRGGALVVKDVGAPSPQIHAERSKLMQVLLNLIKNAGEAFDGEVAPRAGGPPEVVLSAALGDEDTASIIVQDNGPGFDEARAARLFSDGFTTKARGSGIGLASARRIIESLGGRLTLESEGVGRGATARIVLPLAPPAEA